MAQPEKREDSNRHIESEYKSCPIFSSMVSRYRVDQSLLSQWGFIVSRSVIKQQSVESISGHTSSSLVSFYPKLAVLQHWEKGRGEPAMICISFANHQE